MSKSSQALQWLTNRNKILVAICLVFGFAIFAYAYQSMRNSTGLGALNEPVFDWMSSHRYPLITTMMSVATTTASPMFFIIIVSVGSSLWIFRKKEIWRPLLMIIAVGSSAMVSTLVKSLIANPRPDITSMVPPIETSYSFPSGHTISTIVFLLTTGYLFYSRYKAKDKKFWECIWILATIIGTLIIAISRLYLGYHWLTDVVASIGLGLIIFSFVIITDKYVMRRGKLEN